MIILFTWLVYPYKILNFEEFPSGAIWNQNIVIMDIFFFFFFLQIFNTFLQSPQNVHVWGNQMLSATSVSALFLIFFFWEGLFNFSLHTIWLFWLCYGYNFIK